MSVAVPRFWQNFPQAIAVNGSAISIEWWPVAADVHELQGGEQKTHSAVIAFATDRVSSPPLAWVHDPLAVYPTPEWCCGSGVVPFLVPEAVAADDGYLGLVHGGLDPAHGFLAKRELADEYGWRNFGDSVRRSRVCVPAALGASRLALQQSVRRRGGVRAAFPAHGRSALVAALRGSGRHVTDIDIYRTTEDKSAYNGGCSGTRTITPTPGRLRTAPIPAAAKRVGAVGRTQLQRRLDAALLHDRRAAVRDAAIGLGRWVIQMEDGRLTPLRWLVPTATGWRPQPDR
jgi:hypothetical protein